MEHPADFAHPSRAAAVGAFSDIPSGVSARVCAICSPSPCPHTVSYEQTLVSVCQMTWWMPIDRQRQQRLVPQHCKRGSYGLAQLLEPQHHQSNTLRAIYAERMCRCDIRTGCAQRRSEYVLGRASLLCTVPTPRRAMLQTLALMSVPHGGRWSTSVPDCCCHSPTRLSASTF